MRLDGASQIYRPILLRILCLFGFHFIFYTLWALQLNACFVVLGVL